MMMMTGRMLGIVGVAVVVLPALAVSCRSTVLDTRHCANNDGDRHCAEQYPDGSRPFCEIGEGACISPDTALGCVAERPSDECYSPCGGRVLAENDECVIGESSTGSSSDGTATVGSSGSESSTTGPLPCVMNEDCLDEATPFCEPGSGECVTCEEMEDPDGACAGVDPSRPVCLGGTCVQCTPENPLACSGTTPICDDANTCVACTVHDQCGGAACNLYTGACLPADAVVHVGGLTPDYETIADAVGSFGVDEEGTVIVHAGMADYNESVVVDNGRTIGILAAELGPEVVPPRWIRSSGGTPQLTVGAGATVLVDGLELSGNLSSTVPGVLVDGGRAWLDRSRVVQNSGGGVVAQSSAELVLRNCFVGRSENNIAALDINDATARVDNSTIIGGTGSLAEGLRCTAGSPVSVRSSILLIESDNAPIACDDAMFDHCVSEIFLSGTNNLNVGEFTDVSGWFIDTVAGDFHLSGTHPVAIDTAAQWQSGDLLTDIDGDTRPSVDGTPDYAGADVPGMAAAQPELLR